jgi:hypothetical protein
MALNDLLYGMQSFGVRQLAAAFLSASLLAGTFHLSTSSSQQAGWGKSGSKLPHSRASHPGIKADSSF